MALRTAWRLVKPQYAPNAYDGEGARRMGGRWNPPGVAVAYASDSRALAALEILVHVRKLYLLTGLMLVGAQFDSAMVEEITVDTLPVSWSGSQSHQGVWRMGKQWIESKSSLVLAVPSVVVHDEQNYLINPAHPDFAHCEILPPENFQFDPRLKSH